MHSVVDLILGGEHLLETEVVMAFLQGIERDVLVVLCEYVPVIRSGRRRVAQH